MAERDIPLTGLLVLIVAGQACYASEETGKDITETHIRKLKAKVDFRETPISASRPHNTPPPGDENLEGFFLVPGTDTALRLDGFIKADALYDLRPAGNPDELVTSSIPSSSESIHSSNNFTIHAKQTRLSLEARTATDYGELRLYLENDFLASESDYEYRLTSAYGQLGNSYAGFGISAFTDVDALPNTLDAEGPGGSIFTRTASFRHHWIPAPNVALTLSAENPDSQISLDPGALELEQDTNIEVESASRVPDMVVTARLTRHWGHIQAGGILRMLMVEAGSRDDTAWTGGAQLSGVANVTHRDSFQFSLYGGSGISRYINDFGGVGVDALVDEELEIHRLDTTGGYLAFTHHWNTIWSSNAVLSVASLENEKSRICPGGGGDLANNLNTLCEIPRETRYVAFNLLWAPSAAITAGVEALYGYKRGQGGETGETGRIQASVKYRFIP